MGSHTITIWIWVTLASINNVYSHSGYSIPYLPSNMAHDFHHSNFNSNFGIMDILDELHGTNLAFKKHLLSLESKRQ